MAQFSQFSTVCRVRTKRDPAVPLGADMKKIEVAGVMSHQQIGRVYITDEQKQGRPACSLCKDAFDQFNYDRERQQWIILHAYDTVQGICHRWCMEDVLAGRQPNNGTPLTAQERSRYPVIPSNLKQTQITALPSSLFTEGEKGERKRGGTAATAPSSSPPSWRTRMDTIGTLVPTAFGIGNGAGSSGRQPPQPYEAGAMQARKKKKRSMLEDDSDSDEMIY